MDKISNVAELKAAIEAKEMEQSIKFIALKNQFQYTFESLNPVNLILNSISDITSTSYQSNKMFGTISGLLTGYIAKKFASGNSDSSFRKILATVIQLGVTNFIASHAEDVKMYGQIIIEKLFKRKSSI